jgi:hypothetical protein
MVTVESAWHGAARRHKSMQSRVAGAHMGALKLHRSARPRRAKPRRATWILRETARRTAPPPTSPPSPSGPTQSPSNIPRASSRGAMSTLLEVREAPRRVPSSTAGLVSRASKLRSPGLRERLDEGLVLDGGGGGINVVKCARVDQLECGLVRRGLALRCGFSAHGHSRRLYL